MTSTSPGSSRPPRERTRITRLAEKGSDDRAALDTLLDSTIVGHFALTDDAGRPRIVPTAIVRDGDVVLAHGSTGSPWMRALAAGASTCLAVTALDGIVVARSAFESSLHYRSAVLFGACRPVEDDRKAATLDLVTDRLVPGRTAEVRASTAKELRATIVLELPITEWSLKVSDGWPDDGPEDVDGTAWAGIVPLTAGHGTPIPAPDLRAGIEVPESVRRLAPGAD